MRTHPQREAGFTLLELIVALAISSLVAAIGAAAMSTTLGFYQRNTQRSAAREDVRAVERTLRHEWTTRGTSVHSDGLSLEFDTLQPVTIHASQYPAVAHVRYVCENTSDNGLVLSHHVSSLATTSSRPQPSPSSSVQEINRILANHLQACAFSFLGTAPGPQGKPQPQWLATWDTKTPPPDLMRLTLSSLRDDMPAVVYQARTGARPR